MSGMSRIELLRKLRTWRPSDTPIQFQAQYNPYNFGSPKAKWLVDQAELNEDKAAPFFTEAYLYSLLGKQDARSLLSLFNEIEKVLMDERPDPPKVK